MSICRNRLYFESSSGPKEDKALAKTLNFGGSDSEDGDFDLSNEGFPNEVPFSSFTTTPSVDKDKSVSFWDSGIGSPTPITPGRPVPRHLGSPIQFSCDGSDEESSHSGQEMELPPVPPSPRPNRTVYTPPHKKFRSLRIFDTPLTPKSLLQKAQRRVTRATPRSEKGENEDKDTSKLVLDPSGPQTNVNPFSSERPSHGIKRCRNADSSMCEDSFDEDCDEMPCNKKLALHEMNTTRYVEEFHEISKLGNGEFGSVYKCVNRLDGCTYAIKKSKTPVAGSAYERNALNEVYAHAVLGKHQHVVRYYSAWAENGYMYIQNEFCNGGSLAEIVSDHYKTKQHFSELELKNLLIQVAQGLKYIHSQSLVHMDIKPGNVFVHQNPKQNSCESGLEEDITEEDEEEEPITYKIGDLGHVTSMSSPRVEEGDCRYLPNEILQEKYEHLSKADIFSLALTIWEAGGGGVLPKNGSRWHAIRSGDLPELTGISTDFNNLLKSMLHPDPLARPSAATIAQHPVLCPFATKSRAQLRKELNQERFKNDVLSRKLEEAQTSGPTSMKATRTSKSSRLVGKKFHRSMSTTVF